MTVFLWILLGVASYVSVACFVLGWYLHFAPPEPSNQDLEKTAFSGGVPANACGAYKENGFYCWRTNPEWIAWYQRHEQAIYGAHAYAWFWPFIIWYLPFRAIFNMGRLSAKQIHVVIEKQRKEADRLHVIMMQNEIELQALREEAEQELRIVAR